MPLVEQELLTLLEHLSSLPVFSGVRVTRYLVLYVCFVDHCLSFCPFSFGHCVVCSSLIYGFWLPLWYLQTLLYKVNTFVSNVNPRFPLVQDIIFIRIWIKKVFIRIWIKNISKQIDTWLNLNCMWITW